MKNRFCVFCVVGFHCNWFEEGVVLLCLKKVLCLNEIFRYVDEYETVESDQVSIALMASPKYPLWKLRLWRPLFIQVKMKFFQSPEPASTVSKILQRSLMLQS
ncbi:hypothetical protein IFM89_025472 [Coptis chinensis]|uniref:Uncharacterized protein n=1 Tax=Coptis chinensis TaxID=261450 RepID=A0A835HPW3_9MAGN|nr:hypothetical protein IFM89_025472 [Coptis chinensis]